MAPESFKGFSQAKADIWAIGIITYEPWLDESGSFRLDG
jgi:serine/threonine protein kinase